MIEIKANVSRFTAIDKWRIMPFSIFFIILLFGGPIFGQIQDSVVQSLTAEEEIIQLSESTILIRLNSQKKRVDYRKKAKQIKKLEKLEKEIEKEHSEIISAAEEHLSFTTFYFFYSHDSDEVIKRKNYSFLFNSDKKKIREEEYPKTTYLLSLEKPSWFSQIDSYFLILYGIVTGEGKKGIRRLNKPMPFAFRTKSGKLFKRYDFNKAFKKLNERLTSFHLVQLENEK